MLSGVRPFPGVVLEQSPNPDDSTHFTDDASVSLDVKQVSVKVRDRLTIQDITYAGSHGDTVPAYFVIPKGTGKFAGVIWGHWLMPCATNSNREELSEEEIALAPAGANSLLIDAPQSRPNFKPAPDSALVARQVVDLRRGLDFLHSRPDIERARIAYVGHSWDAGTWAILDATDKTFAAFAFMSGPQSTREYVLSSDPPRMVPMPKTTDMAKVEHNLKANAWADPASYANKLGPAPALFQYGLHDVYWVPLADAKDYVAMSSGPKTTEFYDAEHALNAKARMDHDTFLPKTINLIP